ncbi:uncharacterized protein LOC112452303 [Temnothorax curvispinosus]|uniref:Uncharacterized protein LOC112452303 n=1 Tax=Temnothorax curvispinosus TaxID=300111 RepID=A0A6J1PFM4_9HYME|nr:uncharacterized protein LOC112452303 [Temnothorax curvispinosus]
MEADHKYCTKNCEREADSVPQNPALYEAQYRYNNVVYNITDTLEIHNKLQMDIEFVQNYLKKNFSQQKVTKVTGSTSDEADKTFVWTRQKTKLLLECYANRKNDFRNPKLRKRTVWEEIKQDFAKKGHCITIDMLDRKMRNMKHTYKTIQDNNKKNTVGHRRILWEWYETMNNIFQEGTEIGHILRENRIECVKREIESINKLTIAIEENNRLQAETNKIFKALIVKLQGNGKG